MRTKENIRQAITNYCTQQHVGALNPHAVLFDMDGILYNSMPYHARSWYETACRHHLNCTPELFYLYEGRTGESTINELYQTTFGRNATEAEKKSIYEEKARLFSKYNDGEPMTGAAEVLARVKQYNLDSLVVTGSGQLSLIDKLEHNFSGFFKREKMVTAYDVTQGKPHPEPYLMGLQKAKAHRYEALVVENAPMGVAAGVAAGIFTIAVNTGPLEDLVLLDAGANLLFPDMMTLAEQWPVIMEVIRETQGD